MHAFIFPLNQPISNNEKKKNNWMFSKKSRKVSWKPLETRLFLVSRHTRHGKKSRDETCYFEKIPGDETIPRVVTLVTWKTPRDETCYFEKIPEDETGYFSSSSNILKLQMKSHNDMTHDLIDLLTPRLTSQDLILKATPSWRVFHFFVPIDLDVVFSPCS